jgi:hypothetical protein
MTFKGFGKESGEIRSNRRAMGADGADLNRRLQSGKDRRSAIELRPHGDMFATRAVPRQSDCAETVNLNEIERSRMNVVVLEVIKTQCIPPRRTTRSATAPARLNAMREGADVGNLILYFETATFMIGATLRVGGGQSDGERKRMI